MENNNNDNNLIKLEDLSDYDKGLYFYDGKYYNMALYFFNKYKNENNIETEEENRIKEFIINCQKNIDEKNKKIKEEKQTQYKKIIEDEIQNILDNTNQNDIFKITDDSPINEVLNSYKILIMQYHPDINDSPKALEVFNKISESYNEIISKKENLKKILNKNSYELFLEIFKDTDINSSLREAKKKYELKKNGPKETEGKYMPLLLIFLTLGIIFNYIAPKITRRNSMISFIKNDMYPFEKKSHRHKIKYYVNNDFLEKYKTNKEIKDVEKVIENYYLEYLKKNCEFVKEETEKLKKRLVYYRNTSKYYKDIKSDLDKLDPKICDMYEIFNKMLNNNTFNNKTLNITK